MASKQRKSVSAVIQLLIKAGQAKPAPPVGPALGQAGLNIMSFCKDFNAKTADLKDDVPVPVLITAYSDKTFNYVTKTPPVTFFVKKALGLQTASQEPGHKFVGSISPQQIYEIAKIKQLDKPEVSLKSICKSIAGTCKSMGVQVA